MIKKSLVFTLLILISTTIFAQNIFTKIYPTKETNIAPRVTIDTKGNYIIAGAYVDIDSNLTRPFIYKIDRFGDIIDSARYFDNSNNNIFIDEIIPFNDFYAVIASVKKKDTAGAAIRTFAYLKIDSNLNLLDTQFYYFLDDEDIYVTSSSLDKDTNIIMAGWYFSVSGYAGSFITKISPQGDSLAFKIIPSDSIQSFNALHVDSNYYYAFSVGLWDQKIFKYDYNLNLIDKTTIPPKAFEQYTPIFINDSVYYTSGWRDILGYKQFAIMKASLKGTLFNDIKFGIVDSSNQLANTEALCKSGDYFYLYGNPYSKRSLFPYGNGDPSWTYVAKLDTNLNIIWEKLYGGDAFYMAVDITTDTDGGILLLSTRNDLHDGVNQLDIQLMKIDTAGHAVWTQKIKQVPIGVTVFPNPAIDNINIMLQSPNQQIVQLNIIDIQGRIIIQKHINKPIAKVNIGTLPKGVYVIEGYTSKGLRFNGKFVKK